MKKRDYSLDYIRILAIAIIVLFHFCSTWENAPTVFVFHKNGTWGSVGTALFFILSGYLMRKKHSQIDDILSFYKKRWLSIFPAFYIAFIAAYIANIIKTGHLFYLGKPFSLLFSLIGMDNLVRWYNLPSYALVGEWFTGIIIILYILFPFFNKLMKISRWSVTVIFALLYILYVNFEWYPVLGEISIVTCGFLFWIGMLISEYDDLFRKSIVAGVLSLVFFFVLVFVQMPLLDLYMNHLMALLLFIGVFVLTKELKAQEKVSKAIVYLSELSYCVYLVHHYILNVSVGILNKINFSIARIPFLLALIIYAVLIFIVSMVLLWLTNTIIAFAGGKKTGKKF